MVPSRSPLDSFHPIIRRWFAETFGAPSDPQRLGWPAIAEGGHTLILAPTGTGKTLAAFLWELGQLIAAGEAEPLPNAVQILYISPLKALSNDIQRNLERPLAELRDRFAAAGESFPEIRVAVRTGDTPASARARMVRKAPHILITTPESLNIMLTSVKGRGMFGLVRAVIVDEIHAVAGTKRGAHLALSLERLDVRCERPPQRIGLSATQRPLEEIARYLGGCTDVQRSSAAAAGDAASAAPFRPVTIVDCGLVKRMELTVVSPVPDLADVGGSVWPSVIELVLSYIRSARTTLVFVNNRGQAERVAARVNALAGAELARPYHGSLARERRLLLERALKAGELPALVTTSSLELGIDIGSVDLVVQLQSPKRVSAALQRVGRAGHALDAVSRGVFVPMFRDDLMENAALVGAMRDGDVEPTRVPQNALDVLAQVLVAMASVDDWTSADAYQLVRRAYPYHRLTRVAFDEVLAMLAGKYPADLAAELEARLTWDRVTDRVSGSRASRMMAVISGGTIPDRGLYTVHLPDRTRLGELDEEFVHESRVGDVFQLGSATWRIGAIEHDRVIVVPAPGAPARMPFWHGEFSTRSVELGRRVGALRRELAAVQADDTTLITRLAEQLGDATAAQNLAAYVAEQRAATGVVPDDRTILVEQFRDELGAVRLVVHSVFGGRVNAPWGMALAQMARSVLPGVDCQVETSDEGIMLRLPDLGVDPPTRALLALTAGDAERFLLDEVGSTSLFGARFRMNAARALLLPRGNPRRRMPLWLQRLKALDLLDAVRAFPSFPILVETYREVLQDAFDLAALREVLEAIAAGGVSVRYVETERPSPFAVGLQFGFVVDWLYADDTPRAERQAARLSLDRGLLDDVMGVEAADDDTSRAMEEILAARRGTAPSRQARTADELAHLIERAGDLAIDEVRARIASAEGAVAARDPLLALLDAGRVIAIPIVLTSGESAWRFILTESFPRYAAAFGTEAIARVRAGSTLAERVAAEAVPLELRTPVIGVWVARREVLARFAATAGPLTVREVEERYAWPATWVEQCFDEWVRSGKMVRGRFRRGVSEAEWCSRKLVDLARRRALAALRRQIQAVDLATFAAFLQRWQHVDPRDHLEGEPGLDSIVRQLLGLPRPAGRWERDYFPGRLVRYDSAWLSQLAASGDLMWVGGSRPAASPAGAAVATIRFLSRSERGVWLPAEVRAPLSTRAAAVRDALVQLGASFISDLQAVTGLGGAVLRDALRELAATGLVTNDSVEAMREVVHARPLPGQAGAVGENGDADPTRWLPAGFNPSVGRRGPSRRPNVRQLPRWRRPDLPGSASGWVGRWSLLYGADGMRSGTAGPGLAEEERAESIARQWLARYGVVARDWWRRERPPIAWRVVYGELKRLEYRGEVRRGYFVEGLSGAQFALPEVVEQLRALRDAAASEESAPLVALAASDPANLYSLELDAVPRDALTRPRGSGALLVTRAGKIVLSAEGGEGGGGGERTTRGGGGRGGGGMRVSTAPGLSESEVTAAARLLADYSVRRGGNRLRARCVVRSINGTAAVASPHVDAFLRAGFRRSTKGLEFFGGEAAPPTSK